MDLAFVGGEGAPTNDLNGVLLAPLPDATIGHISSGRKHDYGATFRERSGRRLDIAFKRETGRPLSYEWRFSFLIRSSHRPRELSLREGGGRAAIAQQ